MIITGSKGNKNSYGKRKHGIFSVFGYICPVNSYGSTEIRLQMYFPSHHIKISEDVDPHLTKLPEWL